jgi:hypothetical protein
MPCVRVVPSWCPRGAPRGLVFLFFAFGSFGSVASVAV